MIRFFLFISLFFSFASLAQEEMVQSIYFDFDKFNLKTDQQENLKQFIQKIDTTLIESVEIFGYCDDRGKDDYNFVLSTKRATIVKDSLIKNGIKTKIIISIEGKGKVLIDDDLEDNLPEVRSKNRRVDVLVNFKEVVVEELKIPGVYTSVQKKMVVGDRIYLEKLLFERGSSKLTTKARLQLDKIARQLHQYKTLYFEIQGHVCCTPTYQREAIDKATRKRELSKNRAKAVYNYLIKKRIDKKRMTFKGYGNSQPLGKGQDLDRRVELVITEIK